MIFMDHFISPITKTGMFLDRVVARIHVGVECHVSQAT
jgi:hypothetical protein